MELTEKVLKKIEKIYNSVQDYCSYICLSGSSRCDYLDFHRDVDVFIICPNLEAYNQCRDILKTKEMAQVVDELKQKNKVIIIPSSQDREQLWRCEDYIHLYGEEVLFGDTSLCVHKDIFQHENEYLKALTITNEVLKRQLRANGTIGKNMYHLLTGVYLLENGTPDLTKEQIENINMCHNLAEDSFYKIQLLLRYCDEFLTKKRQIFVQNAQKMRQKKEEKSQNGHKQQ